MKLGGNLMRIDSLEGKLLQAEDGLGAFAT